LEILLPFLILLNDSKLSPKISFLGKTLFNEKNVYLFSFFALPLPKLNFVLNKIQIGHQVGTKKNMLTFFWDLSFPKMKIVPVPNLTFLQKSQIWQVQKNEIFLKWVLLSQK